MKPEPYQHVEKATGRQALASALFSAQHLGLVHFVAGYDVSINSWIRLWDLWLLCSLSVSVLNSGTEELQQRCSLRSCSRDAGILLHRTLGAGVRVLCHLLPTQIHPRF